MRGGFIWKRRIRGYDALQNKIQFPVIGGQEMDCSQFFWDSFRESWRALLPSYKDSHSNPKLWTTHYTELIKQAAEAACVELAKNLGRQVKVDREKYNRLDVYAVDKLSEELLVAFESELAPWGHKGDWRHEFVKLCRTKSLLRVLSGTFTPGTGAKFKDFLFEKLEVLRTPFDGEFCLIFGPSPFDEDKSQHWLAYAIGSDYKFRELNCSKNLAPYEEIYG
jgi:hypothetical protein